MEDNPKVVRCIMVLLSSGNYPMPEHSADAVIAELTRLEAENARLREENKRLAEVPHEQDLLYMQAYKNYQTLQEENARLREAARWIKTPEDPPNFDEWHLVAFQGAYYWVKKPPIIEHQEVE